MYDAMNDIIMYIKIHSSCEIEDLVETHLFNLCVIGVCPH